MRRYRHGTERSDDHHESNQARRSDIQGPAPKPRRSFIPEPRGKRSATLGHGALSFQDTAMIRQRNFEGPHLTGRLDIQPFQDWVFGVMSTQGSASPSLGFGIDSLWGSRVELLRSTIERTSSHNNGNSDGRRYAPPLIATPFCG